MAFKEFIDRAKAMLSTRRPMRQNRRKKPASRKTRTQASQLHQLEMEEKADAKRAAQRRNDE